MVREELWRAAIMHRMCQKLVYCLIDKVRAALRDDPDVIEVRWRRFIIFPNLIMFHSDRDSLQEIPIYEHDVIYISCKNNLHCVLDVSGDQFGLEEWFFTSKDYDEDHIWNSILPPPPTSETQLIANLEGEDERLKTLKAAVEKAIVTEETQWAARNLGWSNLHELSESEREGLLEGMASRVEQAVITGLTT